MSREPTRLADLGDAPSPEAAFMGEIIRAQRAPRSPAGTLAPAKMPPGKMEELAARLGPLLDERALSPASKLPWRWISLAAVVLAVTTAWVVDPTDSRRPPSSSAGAHVNTPPPPLAAASAPAVETTAAVPVEALPTVHVQETVPSAPTPARCDEVDLVDRADTKLRSGDPAAALAITREHEQRCAAGALAQERERIAIEALAKLGRLDAARARAHDFEERFPSSPHLRRVRQVLDAASR